MAAWAGCAVRREREIDSTNRAARRWAAEGAPHGAVVVAARQTEGRGRRGRSWESAAGLGLWLSVVIRPDIDAARFPLLSFSAALAAADAVERASGVAPRVKWPNDLLIEGRKIAGILLEKEGDAAIVGIGINVRHRAEDFPPELRDTAGSLRMFAKEPVSLDALERHLLAEIERRIDSGDFFSEYAARCATIGAQVRVVEMNGEFSGVAEGVGADGALLVRDEVGALRRVLAGDVSIREARA